MAGDSNTPEMAHPPESKTPLRTYSRRLLKRRLTSPLLPVRKRVLRRTQSFPAATPEVESGNSRAPEHKSANTGRKRTRFSLTTASGKTPTELFLENMSSPFVMSQRIQLQEQGLGARLQDDQEDIALLEASQDDDAAFDKQAEEPVKVVEKRESTNEICGTLQAVAAEEVDLNDDNSEEANDDDSQESPTKRPQTITEIETPGSSDTDLGFVNTANNFSSRRVTRYKLLSMSPPAELKPKAQGRCFDIPKSPPPGFKAIPRVQTRLGVMGFDQQRSRIDKSFKVIKSTKLTNDQPFKIEKHISDGFTNDEAKPSPYRKYERRIKNILNETHLGGLDLTQRSTATQKMEGPMWLRGQKRSRVATTASPWGKRQYLGGSQFRIESQDPLEAFNLNTEFDLENTHTTGRSKRRNSEIADEEEDEELDLLTHPEELDQQSSQGDAGDDSYFLKVAEPRQERLEQYLSDADESVVLLETSEGEDEDDLTIIPRTDTPEPAVGDLSSKTTFDFWGNNDLDAQLPPKRTWNMLNRDEDSLALRPDSREWLREAERVPDTPPWKDATDHQR